MRGAVMAVDMTTNGEMMVAVGFGRNATAHSALTGEALRTPIDLKARIWSAEVSPVGSMFAIGSEDKALRLYDAIDDTEPRLLQGHKSAIAGVAFSRDGSLVATGSQDNSVRVWSTRTGEPVSGYMPHRGPIWFTTCVAFSPDGRSVVSGCGDRTARVWDVATAKPIGPRLPHESGVRMVAFLDDRTIATGTATGRVRMWNAERGPIAGDVERVRTWIETRTGMRLDEDGKTHALDVDAWRERLDRLAKLGGAPGVR